MRSISFGFAVLTAVLLSACAIENPTAISLPDAGPCGTMGTACCPQVASAPNAARTICRGAGLTCASGTCVACGAPGQPCCTGAAPDGGTSMDAGLAGSCRGTGVACLAGACVDCSGPTRAVCNGQCVSLTTEQNCGACGTTCATAERCRTVSASGVDGGVSDAGTTADGGARVAFCEIVCPPGQVLCGSTCRDLNTDPNNCSACDNQCVVPGAVAGCAAGACTLASCREGFGNCDSNAANGCEIATSTDVTNCGVCGTRCSFANAAATCAAGRCQMGACNAGFADCDRNPANGCEVNTATGDIANCGACNTRCPPPPVGAMAACSSGRCGLALACPSDRRDCNMSATDGCEVSIFTDVRRCGGCGTACSTEGGTASCAGGVCSIMCSAGRGNCDNNVTNGCETNTTSSVAHCGGCGRACALPNATPACTSGACAVGSCNTGFANCNASAVDGCETNTTSDNANCGGCGRICPGGQICTRGTCVVTCAEGQVLCGSTCVNPLTDNNNCGPTIGTTACGRVCTGGTLCQAGNCLCPAGQTNCSGTCRALQTDNANCGGCGTVCGAGTVCNAGTCMASCAAPTTNCSGVCRDLRNDPNNCNACGMVCARTNALSGCLAGTCTLAACNAGFGNCDGNAANGCETNTSTSVTHCGVCGNGCQFANAAASCVAGRCTLGACAPGFANCDEIDSNGCEVNTVAGDINHCGACRNRCPAPPIGSIAVCSNSRCTTSSVSCMAGTADCDGQPANGCEVATTTTANCGVCGRACVGTNGTATCTAGLCGINCSPGFGNCNGSLSDGCEVNTRTSPTNCGGCNNLCSRPNATAGCAAGMCTVASCNAGFDDCDRNPANGCEVNLNSDNANCGMCGRACATGQLCSAGLCVTTCGSGETNCAGTCRNLMSDPDSCGACGTVCSNTGVASRTCGGGVCNGTCAAGRANCDNNLQSNGCETDTNTSVATCGGCTGSACSTSNIVAACSGGNCTGNCTVGFADCNSNKRSDGCEINTTNDPSHCGGCGTVCPTRTNAAATPCVGSACTIGACNPGFGNCDNVASNGCEVQVSGMGASNPSHCGACNAACPARPNSSPACTNGTCGITCNAGFGNCDNDASDGCEINTTTNASHCGACGTICLARANAGATPCVGSACTIGACNPNFGNCDNVAANGCEVLVSGTGASNPNHCGACNAACPARPNSSPVCTNGTCGITCNAGFGDCDNIASNGCENTLDVTTDCGACGVNCMAGQTCTAGDGGSVFSCQ